MTTENYLLLADSVLFLHVMVVVFVVLGLVIILSGGLMKWQWVRNSWFRLSHLCCIAVVVIQAWAGVVCPLTTLEMWLRSKAGGEVYSGSFIAHWLDGMLYYDLPNWLFTTAYTSFGLLVVFSWLWVKPRLLLNDSKTNNSNAKTN